MSLFVWFIDLKCCFLAVNIHHHIFHKWTKSGKVTCFPAVRSLCMRGGRQNDLFLLRGISRNTVLSRESLALLHPRPNLDIQHGYINHTANSIQRISLTLDRISMEPEPLFTWNCQHTLRSFMSPVYYSHY